MGRRKQPPQEQAARGYPGRRRPETDAALKAAVTAEDRERELLARYDVNGLRPPTRYFEKRNADLLKVWKGAVECLIRTGSASAEFQPSLVVYCDAVALYERAALTLQRGGMTIEVTKTNGTKQKRKTPVLEVLKWARDAIAAGAAQFGLTPIDSYSLQISRRRLIEFGAQRDMFRPPEEATDAPAPAAASMDEFDSAPRPLN